jgi:hypothetical protein
VLYIIGLDKAVDGSGDLEMKHDRREILAILDHCCDMFTFPILDNGYVYLAATRLSLFRGAEDWALVIEVFGFSPRSGVPDIHIHSFGSSLENRPVREDFVSADAHALDLVNNPHNQSNIVFPLDLTDCLDEENEEFIAENATSFKLRGRTLDILKPSHFQNANIRLEASPRIQVFEFCRAIAESERTEVLATESEKRFNVPNDLEQLLVLEEWCHPDVADDNKRPSRSETFQQLADVLVTGDTSHYRPTELANTHWKNWPDGGTL